MINRIDNAAFVKQDGFEAALLQFDTAGEAGWARAHNGYVEMFQLSDSAEAPVANRRAGCQPAPQSCQSATKNRLT
jgi:hypothetical protein